MIFAGLVDSKSIQRKIRDEQAKRRKAEELERELDLDGLGILGPSEQLSFTHRYKEYYTKQQAKLQLERYTGGRIHREAEQFGEELLLKLGENDIQSQIRHYGINILDKIRFERIPDYTSERYIMECKTGLEKNFKTIWKEVWEDLSIKEQEGKDVIWYFLEYPVWRYIGHPRNSTLKWQEVINVLESHGVILRYGSD